MRRGGPFEKLLAESQRPSLAQRLPGCLLPFMTAGRSGIDPIADRSLAAQAHHGEVLLVRKKEPWRERPFEQ